MTPEHVTALLAYTGSVDNRFNTPDPAIAAARTRAWASILEGVDPGFAMHHARRFYSKPGQPMITPAEIRSAWAGHLRREDAMTRPQRARGGPPPSGMGEYLRAVLLAQQNGDDPTTVPVPVGRTFDPAADYASRKCRNWRSCACDHTKCRDGWLDQEERTVNGLGKSYPAVKACPHCRDAALMAAELATPVKGRRR